MLPLMGSNCRSKIYVVCRNTASDQMQHCFKWFVRISVRLGLHRRAHSVCCAGCWGFCWLFRSGLRDYLLRLASYRCVGKRYWVPLNNAAHRVAVVYSVAFFMQLKNWQTASPMLGVYKSSHEGKRRPILDQRRCVRWPTISHSFVECLVVT